LNLVFFGAAQTYDTGPLVHPSKEPGVNNDALYTDTTLAFDPDTGKLVWHFQHMPNDQWDLDWAFERQLINLPVKGETKRVVVTAGKEALYDVLDAATGKYDFSMDLGIQNVVTSIDPSSCPASTARVPSSSRRTGRVMPEETNIENVNPSIAASAVRTAEIAIFFC